MVEVLPTACYTRVVNGIGFGSALSMHPIPAHATGEVVGDVLEAIGPTPTLAVLFVTHALTGALDDIVGAVQQMLQPTHLLAITTSGVLGSGSEVEDGSALALWAVRGGTVETFLLPGQLTDGFVSPDQEHRPLPCDDDCSGLVVLADAESFDLSGWLGEQNPRLAVAGARFAGPSRSRIAPAASRPFVEGSEQGARFTPNLLFRNGRKALGGALAVAFGPEFVVQTLVAQSCRPVGNPFTVTKAERNVIYAMGGQSASAALDLTVEQCDDTERTLLRRGIHLGVVVNGGLGLRRELSDDDSLLFDPLSRATKHPKTGPFDGTDAIPDGDRHDSVEGFGLGDFVVHNVLGADRNAGALALSGSCEVGDVVQFHVTDAAAARAECQLRLAEAFANDTAPMLRNSYGALLFSSATRGIGLFGTEHHDAAAVGEYSALAASAGAFCSTPLGPIGDLSGQHQSALTIALLRAATL